ncbi:MAG: class I SAM-dependent methyltransferase [Myxococcota bacterium]
MLAVVEATLRPIAPVATALDFGAGEGWYARRLLDAGILRACVAVDVVRRPTVYVEPLIYGGRRVPLDDRSVELAFAIDVLHHCPDPRAGLAELARVSGRWVLVKDHTCRTAAGRAALRVLDELGNRRFAIGSPGHYQRRWAWDGVLEASGFALRARVHPAPVGGGWIGRATDRLQYVSLWERPT